MAGRYTGSYLGRIQQLRAVAILADSGQASSAVNAATYLDLNGSAAEP
jgi:hypothetical protein